MMRSAVVLRALGAPSRRLALRPQFKPQFACPAIPIPTLHVARRSLATSTDGTPASSTTPTPTAEQLEAQQQAAIEAQQQESHRQEVLQQEIAQSEYDHAAQQEKLEDVTPVEGQAAAAPAAGQPKPNLPYHVGRTPTNNLAVYQKAMRGGTLKLTFVKKITGDREALRAALAAGLGLEDKAVQLNSLTGNLKVVGFKRDQVQKWLEEQGF